MNGSFELRSEASRIRSWLPRLREQRDEAEERYHQLEQLLQDEKAVLVELLDAADRLDGNETGKVSEAPRPSPAPKPAQPGAKLCPGCGETKDREGGFYRNRTAHDGLQNRCKECDRARTRGDRERKRLLTAS